MSVAAFLAELRSRNIGLWADGDQLRCNAPAGVLTPELRDQLQQRKRDILDFLRSAQAIARQERAIVPLQPAPAGRQAPVFGVAGHNGDVFCYRALAQHLGEDQPFYGLQPPGVDGLSDPLTCVEELAAYFVEQIRAFRPAGPYVIAGYCAGGTIAFDVARQLVEGGAAINFVALFASPYPTWYRFLPQLRLRAAERRQRLRAHARALASGSPAERWEYIAERWRQHRARRDARHDAAPDPVLVLRARVEAATRKAVCRYTPPRFDGRISLFHPNKAWLHPRDRVLRWRAVARDIEEYVGPDEGTADSMLLEPDVRSTADLFRRCRAKADGRMG